MSDVLKIQELEPKFVVRTLSEAKRTGLKLSAMHFSGFKSDGVIHAPQSVRCPAVRGRPDRLESISFEDVLQSEGELCKICSEYALLAGGWVTARSAITAIHEVSGFLSLSAQYLENEKAGVSNVETEVLILEHGRKTSPACSRGDYPKGAFAAWFKKQDMRPIIDVWRKPFSEESIIAESAEILKIPTSLAPLVISGVLPSEGSEGAVAAIFSRSPFRSDPLQPKGRSRQLTASTYAQISKSISRSIGNNVNLGLYLQKVTNTYNASRRLVFEAPLEVAQAYGLFRPHRIIRVPKGNSQEVFEILSTLFKDNMEADGELTPQELYEVAKLLAKSA